eukprot:CAMPEP_0170511852 /NCGR_PEP_ID=MMETSP0208-20121228/66527_1 /TAXON_ID=197538 /ORGANISM="Strombidium inclinatum, Strain S3" /LENGTH=193 /DNA_ID=CAMNT_0010795423 /DNA_START=119 /DNA_END=699 /DNA_ORIENTATION=+
MAAWALSHWQLLVLEQEAHWGLRELTLLLLRAGHAANRHLAPVGGAGLTVKAAGVAREHVLFEGKHGLLVTFTEVEGGVLRELGVDLVTEVIQLLVSLGGLKLVLQVHFLREVVAELLGDVFYYESILLDVEVIASHAHRRERHLLHEVVSALGEDHGLEVKRGLLGSEAGSGGSLEVGSRLDGVHIRVFFKF